MLLSSLKYLFTTFLFSFSVISYGQDLNEKKEYKKNRFKYIDAKFHSGFFLKNDKKLAGTGLLDKGYRGVTIKLGWQPSNPEEWESRYGYPSYGVGFYSGSIGDARVFGSPNGLYGFIKFPVSNSDRRNEFAISPSLGVVYKLKPYHPETNPVNTAIGTRAAIYFNLDLGFTYKWTRRMDLLYGFDFSHFSNGSVYEPNTGLNLYGLNIGLSYHYNTKKSTKSEELNLDNVYPVRFNRPKKSPFNTEKNRAITIYLAGGVAQNDSLRGSDILLGTFTGVIDYEYHFNEMNAITAGVDLFHDNRLQHLEASDRWLTGIHVGYDFRFWRFAVKMQVGTYLGDDKGKGAFFLRPALRYDITKRFFSQLGFKTLDYAGADFIEAGIGYKPFSW